MTPSIRSNPAGHCASALAPVWQRAMEQMERARAAFEAHDARDYESERSLAIYSERQSTLIEVLPAPDLSALLWKLEYLFSGSGDHVDSWSLEFVAQTLADCRRLLGES